MTAKTIISIAAVIVLTACSASEDQELREFLSRHDYINLKIRDIRNSSPYLSFRIAFYKELQCHCRTNA